jgi:choline dehydrogenase-like flavoprotein
MLIHIEELAQQSIPPCDICIVGAGAAGIEIARAFNKTPLSVYLVEGGRLTFDWNIQNLTTFSHNNIRLRHPEKKIDQKKPYELDDIRKHASTLRLYGGTMNIWGGLWKRLDKIDFEDKECYNLSTWPIPFNELQHYYEQVKNDYGTDDWFIAEEKLSKEKTGYLTDFPNIIPSLALQDKEVGYVGEKHLETFKRSDNIKLIMGANATKINLSEDLRHIHSIDFKSLSNKEISIQAKQFILACGTIENTRLMLSSNDKCSNGVGNQNNLVGKNFLSHPKGSPTIFVPNNQKVNVDRWHHYKESKFQFGLSLNHKILKKWGLPNHHLLLSKCMIKTNMDKIEKNIYSVRFFLEHLPNLESQITLTDKKNELGLPIPYLDLKLSKLDAKMFLKFFTVFNKVLESYNLGEMIHTMQLYELHNFNYPSHFLGTTRMAKSPLDGVVDENCKVFGIDNLYISGGSVFPTVGSANPTFTIIALAKRLAHHIYRS